MHRFLSRAVRFVAALGFGATVHACGCDCASPAVSVFVPASRARDVANVTATGATCQADVRCGNAVTNTPLSCTVIARAEGDCRIEIAFTSGAATVTADANFRRFTGCCSGIYPSASQGFVQVPELADAGADASRDASDATATE